VLQDLAPEFGPTIKSTTIIIYIYIKNAGNYYENMSRSQFTLKLNFINKPK